MWEVFQQEDKYTTRTLVKTSTKYQAEKVTNALNKMAMGEFNYKESTF